MSNKLIAEAEERIGIEVDVKAFTVQHEIDCAGNRDVDLISRLTTALKEREWRPISEAPKNRTRIIGYAWDFLRERHDIEIIWYETNKDIIEFEGFTNGFKPNIKGADRLWSDGGEYYTHFMPLPHPPVEGE